MGHVLVLIEPQRLNNLTSEKLSSPGYGNRDRVMYSGSVTSYKHQKLTCTILEFCILKERIRFRSREKGIT